MAKDTEWKRFQDKIATIERMLGSKGKVESPARLSSPRTGQKREIDVLIRLNDGPRELKIALECRRRKCSSDVTWIEQLITKRDTLGLDRIIAVSAKPFTPEAKALAQERFIEIMELSQFYSTDWEPWLECQNLIYNEKGVDFLRVQVILQKPQTFHSMPDNVALFRNRNMELLTFGTIWHSSCASYYASLVPGEVVRRTLVLQVQDDDPLELCLDQEWKPVAAFQVEADIFVREISVPLLPAETYRNILDGQVVLGYTETAFPIPGPDGKRRYIGFAKVPTENSPPGSGQIKIIERPVE